MQDVSVKTGISFKKWILDETPGQAGRLKTMAYGSSSYDLFVENIDLTWKLQSTFRILRKTLFSIWSHLRAAYYMAKKAGTSVTCLQRPPCSGL